MKRSRAKIWGCALALVMACAGLGREYVDGGEPRGDGVLAHRAETSDSRRAKPRRSAGRAARDAEEAVASDRTKAEAKRAPAAAPPPPPASDEDAIAEVEDDAASTTTGDLSTEDGSAGTTRSATPRPKSPRKGARAAPRPRRAARPSRPPPKAGVKAGAADDNLQFNAYLRFLADNRGRGLPFAAERRRIVTVRDAEGRPWPDATVELRRRGRQQAVRQTYADGRTLLFPPVESEGAAQQGWTVNVRAGQRTVTQALTHRRAVEVTVPDARPPVDEVPLDIAFVLDTTGSMQDEIDKLRATLNTINFQVSHASPRPDVRYGMVLYRDVDDAYRTRVVPFTRDLDAFSRALGRVSAGGGDDYPEDVQAGLQAAMTELGWADRGVKVAFLIGDAPPHLDYGQRFTYLVAAERAAQQGIKIATIGASGLDKTGEVVWRQIAQQTMAPFVFLTYGEKGDSEGSPSTVSHHVGANWVADDLDAIVIRMVKQELAHWRPKGAPTREDYFIARPAEDRPPDQVLQELFAKSTRQLVDYAVESIEPGTPTVILPFRDPDPGRARRLERRLAVGLSRLGPFQLIEKDRRGDMLQAIAQQMAHAYDETKMVEVGKMVPARLAVLGAVDPGDDGPVELLVKLVRLETGEVLSLSLMRIDRALL